MSDANAGAAEVSPSPTPEAASQAPEAASQAAETEWTPETRAYIEKLRSENKSYRERWQPFERAFGSLDPKDQKTILDLASIVNEDPRTAAAWMAENASDFARRAGASIEELLSTPPPTPTRPSDGPLTAEEVARIVEERTRETQEQIRAEINRERIKRELQDLGYDPASKEAKWLLIEAAASHNNDLRAAHEAFQTWQAELAKAALERLSQPAPPATPASAVTPQPPAAAPTADEASGDAFEAAVRLARQRQKARMEATRQAQAL